jgi:anti-sigma factor RsiW
MFKAFKSQSQPSEERVDELLSAYLDGMLTSDERLMLDARLRQEPALQKRLEALRLTVDALAHLPVVQTPRNFILSPSMVAPARPAPRRRQRRTWQVFGWATAVAAVLFLLVFASDVFVVAPSLRSEPTQVLLEERGALEGGGVPEGGEVLKQVQVVEEVVVTTEVARAIEESEVISTEAAQLEAEVPAEMAEAAAAVGEKTPTAMVGAAPAALVARGEEEEPTAEAEEEIAEAEVPAAEDVYQGTPVPNVLATPPGQGEAEEPLAPEMPASTVTEQEPLVAPVPSDTLQAETVPGSPLSLTPIPVETEKAAEGTPIWLRLAEIGLGLAVIGLATATLILRWRSV